MAQFVVHPDRHHVFGNPSETFLLLTQADRVADFSLAPSTRYSRAAIGTIEADESLDDVLRSDRCPASADIFVVCPDRFVTSPEPASLGPGRRLVAMPCGSTPVTDAQVAYFLTVVESTDPVTLEARADRLFGALSETPYVWLTAPREATSATFAISGDYEWNQQAGTLGPGEQQIAPSGEASAAPTGLYRFDTSQRLDVNGTITLLGAPIVHRGDDPDCVEEQATLFKDLDALRENPVIMTFTNGLVTDVRPTDPAGKGVVAALTDLYAADEAYRVLWEFGIGLNPVLRQQPGNCGLNEMFGANNGVVHLGFGLTPTTRYALTFTCADTVMTDEAGTTIAGPVPPRRLVRRRTPDCGC
ncbi:hypothetical protein Ga0074812_10566 [Parafrankia irregularis]|uniref:Uncharacterized protein n=1 Tax=Parafrankia irregularis TaxID=795642 RepID=A0A0S4QKP8_9ACTN|nr:MULTISPECIES: hypothetical protein [Parafrankia]MBE3205684.1 hypothetical protein [Parafrankia sp. CH37]CUU55416.1 hypothetical protein Ga0074812_10566 [Parafrankia irregularis]